VTRPSNETGSVSSVADAVAEPIEREIHIDAASETVFEFFTDATKLTGWLAAEATLDPRPGGVCHQEHPAADGSGGIYHMRGEFVEVTPPERVVFTWGFTNPDAAVPPGSTAPLWNVIDLLPEGRGEWMPDNRYPGARRGEPARLT
jgi:uncharacterized protein YndB with AHSA1/START domain